MNLKIVKIVLVVILFIVIISIIFVLLWKPFGKKASKDEFDNYSLRNEWLKDGEFNSIDSFNLYENFNSKYEKNSKYKPDGEIPIKKINNIKNSKKDELNYIWFGHSSGLLQISGYNVLIDPVFSDYATPLVPFGPKRIANLPIGIDEIPNIDVVLISHDHYDHLDYYTIMNIDSKVKKYIVPLGVENHLIRWGIDKKKIETMSWWEEVDINNIKIVSTPGQHFSGRLPWNANTTLWSGYIVKNKKYQVYYSGDTGYGSFFNDINKKYGNMDLVLIEDGQYNSRWPKVHMSPEEGMKALKDLNSKYAIPIHWAGFVMSNHDWNAPAVEYVKLSKQYNVNIAIPYIGQIVNYDNISSINDDWWNRVDK